MGNNVLQNSIVLCNSNVTDVVLDCRSDNLSDKILSRETNFFSEHLPLRSEILLNVRQLPNAAAKQYAIKKTDCRKINESVENEPFQPNFP